MPRRNLYIAIIGTSIIVPRFRRRRQVMRAPIVSFKHQRSEIISYVGGNANNEFVVNFGTDTNVAVAPGTTPNGNKQYSVDVTINFVSGSANAGTDFSWMLVHLREEQTVLGLFGTQASNWSSIGLASAKNQVIESHMGTVATEDGGSYAFKKHIKLPKMWHRVRNGDQLILVWNCSLGGVLAQGVRYKTYS